MCAFVRPCIRLKGQFRVLMDRRNRPERSDSENGNRPGQSDSENGNPGDVNLREQPSDQATEISKLAGLVISGSSLVIRRRKSPTAAHSHKWFFFSFLDIRAWVDLCMIALQSIWVANGDVMHHGCTLSAWVQQAEFNIILFFKPLHQEHSKLCCSFAK